MGCIDSLIVRWDDSGENSDEKIKEGCLCTSDQINTFHYKISSGFFNYWFSNLIIHRFEYNFYVFFTILNSILYEKSMQPFSITHPGTILKK